MTKEINKIIPCLKKYADKNGKNWKKKLIGEWYQGSDLKHENGHLLRQARNKIGPSGLMKLKI